MRSIRSALVALLVAPPTHTEPPGFLDVMDGIHEHTHITGWGGIRYCNGVIVDASHTVLDIPRARGYVIPEG